MNSRSRICFGKGKWLALLGLLVLQMPMSMFAQIAPDGGAHNAARPSDTGFQGAVDVSGDYSVSVPLNFPDARNGLKVPLEVRYGGKQFGAAGVGWDVPLSYILRSTSSSRRRPAPHSLQAPERMSLSLNGNLIDLVRNSANTAWVPRRGSSQIEVRSGGDGLMVAYDGQGHTYQFSAQSPLSGGRLLGGNMFLLRKILAMGSNSIELGYGITAPTLAGGGAGLAINLLSVSYNKSPTASNCFKHKILLSYDASSSSPMAISMLDGIVLARVQKLTGISVRSKETCASAEKILSDYKFGYAADADTRLPRLTSVTMQGQQGTPERNLMLPVASYAYGSVVDLGSNKITYQKVQSAGPPDVPGRNHYAHGISVSGSSPVVSTTFQSLLDLNGDGRADFYNIGADERIYANVAGTAPIEFALSSVSSSGHWTLGKTATQKTSFQDPELFGNYTRVTEYKRQFIDMNGDGRLDYVVSDPDRGSDANEEQSTPKWHIFLNTPDPSDPKKIKWMRRTAWVRNVDMALGGSGAANASVPLGRTTTVSEVGHAWCWRANAGIPQLRWVRLFGWGGLCGPRPTTTERRKTITEFELKDVNGDGYPDFIYNASRVEKENHYVDHQPAAAPTHEGQIAWTSASADISGSRDVKVLINTAGAMIEDRQSFDEGQEIFSAPLTLESAGSSGCGVARWQSAPGDVTNGKVNQICAFQDINGDGIADRVTTTDATTTALLGTGDMNRPFAGSSITLPGPLSRSEVDLIADPNHVGKFKPAACPANSVYYVSTTRALRDINGDAVPDYIESGQVTAAQSWKVSFGSGIGFTAPVDVELPTGFAPSWEKIYCADAVSDYRGQSAGTAGGLFELDGDGQPELVVKNDAAAAWDIYQLKPATAQVDVSAGVSSAPASGRLIRIDNGYGASTTIGYRSAKEDLSSEHNVPFPEIVVESIGTKDASSNVLLSTTRYAYRGSEMIFDRVSDGFRFPGHRRSVSLTKTGDADSDVGVATITDIHGLEPFVTGMSATARFKRYLMAGLTRDVTVLTVSGTGTNDPRSLLDTDIASDARRIRGTHYDWDARKLSDGAAPAGDEQCIDMIYPFDFAASKANALSTTDDVCEHRGFVFQRSSFAWRGTPGTDDAVTSTQTVQTSSTVDSIDDYERVTSIRNDGDLMRGDDDLCTQIVYAEPTGSDERVLDSPATKTTTNCGSSPITLKEERWEYDTSASGVKLPEGQISSGLVTAHIVSRLDAVTGTSIPDALGRSDIRLFDAKYDISGNPIEIIRTRDDGASHKATMTYDDFGLVLLSATIDATNPDGTKPPLMKTISEIDATTLKVLTTTDANGAKRGNTYDGFGRLLLSKVKPVGASEGVQSSLTYNGFAVGQSGGRTIVEKRFVDPVSVSNVGTAAGRLSKAYLDTLGRTQRIELDLGADYANKKLIVGQRSYDTLGRVRFEADAFLSTDDFSGAYGTTQHFNADGTPSCSIRGYGNRPRLDATDQAIEHFESCVSRAFVANQEVIQARDASSLQSGTPQEGTMQQSNYSATGQLLGRVTSQASLTQPFAEAMEFGYDALGHLTEMKRFQDPLDRYRLPPSSSDPGKPVTARWRYDSLGQVIKTELPGSAAQNRSYSSWGELTLVQWNDPTITTPGGNDRRTVLVYDALGRLIHSEDRTKNVVDTETVNDYLYDQGVNTATPAVTAMNVLGRMAKATSPTGSVAYSYDGLGRVNVKTYIDTTVSPNKTLVEKRDIFGNGSLKALHLLLPDNVFKVEKFNYVYDSADRVRSIKYDDGVNRDLFVASGAVDIDVFGRVRNAKFGAAIYTANYADVGRRLPTSVKIASPAPMSTSREIEFPLVVGVPAFDAMGREQVRRESKDGVALPFTANSRYDATGRLQKSSLPYASNSTTQPFESQYEYDPLGNLVQQRLLDPPRSTPATVVALTYGSVDRDRICSIGYGSAPPPAACNVKYDGVGNVIEIPTRNSGLRTFAYFANGRTKSIVNGSTNATFKYDAFGSVQQLTLNGATSADRRRDKRFGDFLTQREENGATVLTRRISGPGFQAVRHGPAGGWTFEIGEVRGNRFVTDQNGAFVQDIHYQPYGEVIRSLSGGALPGSTNYSNVQWNYGDALTALGVSQLGARIYDPIIGRFMSRDPLIIPRTAATTSPYAFAFNDPVNRSDPTGLDPDDPEPNDQARPRCEGCRSGEVILVDSTAPRSSKPGDRLGAGDVMRGARPGSGAGEASAGLLNLLVSAVRVAAEEAEDAHRKHLVAQTKDRSGRTDEEMSRDLREQMRLFDEASKLAEALADLEKARDLLEGKAATTEQPLPPRFSRSGTLDPGYGSDLGLLPWLLGGSSRGPSDSAPPSNWRTINAPFSN